MPRYEVCHTDHAAPSRAQSTLLQSVAENGRAWQRTAERGRERQRMAKNNRERQSVAEQVEHGRELQRMAEHKTWWGMTTNPSAHATQRPHPEKKTDRVGNPTQAGAQQLCSIDKANSGEDYGVISLRGLGTHFVIERTTGNIRNQTRSFEASIAFLRNKGKKSKT